jgi:hypothetical protein
LLPSNLGIVQPNNFDISERCSYIVKNEIFFNHDCSNINLKSFSHRSHSTTSLEVFGGVILELVLPPIRDHV